MSFDALIRADHHARIARLEAEGASFVTATVVLRRAPVSSHMGDRAIVHADGRMEGFVGGACSREIVRKQALEVLELGQPRLVMIRPDSIWPNSASEPDAGGEAVVVPMTCASEGSVNVYLEPHLPPRTLLVVGLTPVAEMVYRLASSMGERAVRVLTTDERRDLEPETAVVDLADLPVMLARLSPAALAQLSAVVASQGHYDELALEALLRGGVSSLALLSSRKRAVTVRELLTLQGVSEADVARIQAPAGMDIGAKTPGEVALSILAGLVEQRQGGVRQVRTVRDPAPARTPAMTSEPATAVWGVTRPGFARSPVDGEEIEIARALHHTDHLGQRFYFTCPNCKRRFLKDPQPFLDARETLQP
jgi:xanthine dehydrogenase accessory factor